MNFDINEQSIDSLGVYELRQVARSLGIKSPTSKKVDVLKEEILKVARGEEVPHATTSRGRPPKSFQIQNQSSTIIPKTIFDVYEKTKRKKEEFNDLVLESSGFYSSNSSKDQFCRGYVLIATDDVKYFWNRYYDDERKYIVFIPPTTQNYDKIFEGDFIEGFCESSIKQGCLVLTDYIRINSYSKIDLPNRQCIDFTKVDLSPAKNATFFGQPVVYGGRYIVYDDHILDCFHRTISQMQNYDNYVFVGLEITPEVEAYLNEYCETAFYTRFGDPLQKSFDILSTAIDHIISRAKDGDDLLIYVHDVCNIEYIIKTYLSVRHDGFVLKYSSSFEIVKKLFSLGRAFNNSSLTLFASCTTDELDDNLISELKRCCMGIFKNKI